MIQGRPLRIGMLVGSMSVAGGGVSEALRALCLALDRIPGISPEVFSLRSGNEPMLDFAGIPIHLARTTGPSAFGYAPDLGALIARRQPDILHVHGLWMYLSVAARSWHRNTGRPYVVSPHGMLDPWALRNGSWKKWLARRLYENAHLGGAACIHALCDSEKSAVRTAGLKRPVVIMPNGVEQFGRPSEPPVWRKKLPDDAKILMFLGRLTPKKGVAALTRAWCRVSRGESPWHLVLVGPDEGGYRRHLADLAARGPGAERIHLVGPAYGQERSRAYASATAFVLPSLSEGLPLAALEALSLGIPALLTEQCNLPEAFEAGCALPIGTSEDAICEGLETLFSLPVERLESMGAKGRALIAERFNWDTIAARFADLYRHLAKSHSGERPSPAGRSQGSVSSSVAEPAPYGVTKTAEAPIAADESSVAGRYQASVTDPS